MAARSFNGERLTTVNRKAVFSKDDQSVISGMKSDRVKNSSGKYHSVVLPWKRRKDKADLQPVTGRAERKNQCSGKCINDLIEIQRLTRTSLPLHTLISVRKSTREKGKSFGH